MKQRHEMNLKRKKSIKTEKFCKISRKLEKKARKSLLTCSVDLDQLARERRVWQRLVRELKQVHELLVHALLVQHEQQQERQNRILDKLERSVMRSPKWRST